MGEALGLLVLLLLAGTAYVVLRLILGPGRYRFIIDPIANGLFVSLCSGGFALLFLFNASAMPSSFMNVFGVVFFSGGALIGFGLLWLSAYALWFWRRPLVELDNDGVRLWALAYREVPWNDIAAVIDRSDNTEIPRWFVLFADGYRGRLGYLPIAARQAMVGWGREPAEITAAADLIRGHPNYREKASA